MIDKREIIDTATALGLNPHVVEKDYVLGWLSWGIRNHRAVGDGWMFKGGTCLKKCFFETYRFSEDLDFTLDDPAHVDEGFLISVVSEITARIYEETGIEFPSGARRFDVYENPRGRPSCQVRVGYRGPVSPRGRNVPRIKFDLSADERLVLPPVQSGVFHPYSDEPEGGIVIRSYAYEEAFGEKIRALAERPLWSSENAAITLEMLSSDAPGVSWRTATMTGTSLGIAISAGLTRRTQAFGCRCFPNPNVARRASLAIRRVTPRKGRQPGRTESGRR